MQVSAVIGLVLLAVFLIALGPLLLICGINWMIEPLGQRIPYGLGTWFGAFLIMMMLKGSSTSKK